MPQLDVGASIGDYRIEAVLGRGGMGTVYRAWQTSLARPVALKVLADDLSGDVSFRERFVRESRLVAASQHRNIIPVYDAGEQDGVLYLTMQLVEGPDLQTLVAQQGALDPRWAAEIVSEVGAALDAAHARSLVHRDVKPSNVLIDRRNGREHVYLTDFGLAKRAASRGLTQAGVMVGTVDYVSPEAITGGSLDARADVYALGAVLYYALTGRVPYAKDSDVAVLYAHVSEPPPRPTDANPAVPAAFDEVVARAMAKHPEDRYRTAGEVGAAAVEAAAQEARVATAVGAAAPSPEPPTLVAVPQPAAPAPELHRPVAPPLPDPETGSRTVLVGRPSDLVPPSVVAPVRQDSALVSFRLQDDFRYVHEPLTSDHRMPFLGTRLVVDSLKERIGHSTGGSFLITGFRGVGKTTVIKRALEELTADNGAGPHIVPISLNVARPMSTDELLFEVIRRLFEALIDGGIFERLHPEIQRALVLSYTRTSLSFKETRAKALERGRTLDLGLGALAGPVVGGLTPKLSFSKKETRSLATEAAFLAYSDADVEHDFLRIVSLVHRAEAPPAPARRWAWPRRSREAASPWLGHLVVVIDELDKLTERDDGPEYVEQILAGLKNLLTTRGVHFLFVAGPDLHDRALKESHQGNSVYESVFGWHVYVPCMWDAPGQLLDRLVCSEDQDDEWYALLRDYLTFKARGIPRLLLIELNSYVSWQDGHPVLKLDEAGIVRVKFYASLQRILADFLGRSDNGSAPFAIPIDEDRWRLGAYYVTDWILRRKDAEFTVDDIVGSLREERTAEGREAKKSRTASRPYAVAQTLVVSTRKVEQLIEHLVERGILEQVRGRPDQAYQSDAPAAQKATYAVVKEKYDELARVERGSERERAELAENGDGLGSQPWDESGTFGLVAGGRYELLRELDRGGIASVYHARDRVLGRDVAVKMLEKPSLLGNPTARARFERQGAIASALVHPNIVPTYDTFELDDQRMGIVMQLVEGVSLRSVLDWAPLPGREAVRLAAEILDALEYVSDQGIVRLDLKPSNVILDPDRKPIIVDLGLAKVVDGPEERRQDVTMVGALIGTPAYFSPEQATGGPVDIRTDIYTVGLLVYEMLTGRPARRGDQVGMVIEQARHADIDPSGLPVSAELRDVVARALARNPDERFASPAEMRAALLATPEASPALAPVPA